MRPLQIANVAHSHPTHVVGYVSAPPPTRHKHEKLREDAVEVPTRGGFPFISFNYLY